MAALLDSQVRAGEFAREERMRPLREVVHRYRLRRLHTAVTDAAVVVGIPVRRHIEPRIRFRPFILGESPDHQSAVMNRERQWGMRKSFPVQRSAIAVSGEEHTAHFCWLPPGCEHGRVHEDIAWKKCG